MPMHHPFLRMTIKKDVSANYGVMTGTQPRAESSGISKGCKDFTL